MRTRWLWLGLGLSLGCAGPGSTPRCAPNEVVEGAACRAVCSPDERYVAGQCELHCVAGEVRVGERCLPACPFGQERVGERCVAACAADQERVDGQCVAACSRDEQRVDGTCVGPSPVRVNSVGYLPNSTKLTVVTDTAASHFILRDQNDDSVVYEGELTGPIESPDTQEQVWHGDFSQWRTAGRYYVEVEDAGRSAPFEVREDVYQEPLRTVMLGYYGLRCGQAVHFEHQGHTFAHGACHLEDALASLSSSTRVPATGGWHDAGDYGKYMVNSGFTVGMLLLAWEQVSEVLGALEMPELPEHDNDVPDYLDELRFQLEWMLTMQHESGAVHHKLSAATFAGFILPERDLRPRALAPVSAEATADFAAALARAARVFEPWDAAFAERCLLAAERAVAWLQDNPAYPRVDLTGFDTGAYITGADDDRLWAQTELWRTTGDARLLEDLEGALSKLEVRLDWDWSNVENLALFTYALSDSSDRTPAVVEHVRERILETAEALVDAAQVHAYGRSFGANYYWGSNGVLARTVITLAVAHALQPDERYRSTAQRQLDHLFGLNVFSRSQVTGIGHLPPRFPHHRPSGADAVSAPWPGLLVGGPNGQENADNQGYDLSIPAKAWQDVQASYWSNEIAINWNAPLVYALAWLQQP